METDEMFTINHEALKLALSFQEDELRLQILAAEKPEDFKTALLSIELLQPSWEAVGCGYKMLEIRLRLRDSITIQLAHEEAFLSDFVALKGRKTAKVYKSVQAVAKKLQSLINAI